MMELIKGSWNGNAALEHLQAYESESNEAVERAIQTWEGQVRTMKDALEHRLRCKVMP